MSTGSSLPCSRIHFKNDNPSCPGSTTSNSSKSGCSRVSASRAASAESASAIRYFASSALRSPYLAAGSSSTINRSEEHTSELQSRLHLVCRLLLEKKKNK